MSIALMTHAWKTHLPSTQKLVLLALCDNANDQGECYPSVSTLVEKCSLSERAIQGALRQLTDIGYVKRDTRAGRATLYLISDPRTWCTPAEYAPPDDAAPTPAPNAPPHDVHPRSRCTTPPHDVHPTPAARAPITVIEPSRKRKAAAAPLVAKPDGVSELTWQDFTTLRKSKRAPITETVLRSMSAEAKKCGQTLEEAMVTCCKRNWQGYEAEWVLSLKKTEAAAEKVAVSYV